ncbi:unnamed protein product [Nesidiocoris tenuis]|uniref:Uncharacterized protein n=1 Tax=Nesidiocoris tenuis TaxID=355587 RepID=A0A6H5G043_9HEMI|nr:unnamed protein product [Nesidiocoris tenuis]
MVGTPSKGSEAVDDPYLGISTGSHAFQLPSRVADWSHYRGSKSISFHQQTTFRYHQKQKNTERRSYPLDIQFGRRSIPRWR